MKIDIIVVLIAVVMAGCSEDIELTLSSTAPRLVIDGHITDSETPYNYVSISMSTDYFSNCESPAVSGARVVVSDGASSYLFEESETAGRYVAPKGFYGQHGMTYTLRVSGLDVDGDGETETYTASEPMPPTYDIDSVQCYKNSFSDFYQLCLFAHEDTDTRNFYMFGYSYNDSLITDTFTKFASTDDSYFTSDYCWGATIAYISDGDLRGGKKVKAGDTVTMHAMSVNEGFYDYVSDISDIASGSTAYSSAPANAVGNINNGEVLGYFAVFATVSVECVVRD